MSNIVRISEASKMLGVSRNNLSYQIRVGVGPFKDLGYYCPPIPGNKKGQFVFYRDRLIKFIGGDS